MAQHIEKKAVLQLVAFVIIYVAAAKFSLWTGSYIHHNVSGFWLPTGLALGAALLFGTRIWPAVLLGATLATWSTGAPLLAAVGVGVGNTLEILAAIWLLRYAGFDSSFSRLRDVWVFLICAAMLAPLVSTLIGVHSLSFGGVVPPHAIWDSLQVWWIGNASSAIVITPLLLAWRTALPWVRQRPAEAVVLAASVVAVGLLLIFPQALVYNGAYPVKFLLFPLLIWGAIRYGIPGASLVILLMQATALYAWSSYGGLWSAAHFSGFVLPVTQAYFGVAAIVGLIIAVVLHEQRHLAKRNLLVARQLDGVLSTAQSGVMAFKSQRNADGLIEDFCWEFCNQAAMPMLGHVPDDLLGKRLLEVCPWFQKDELFSRYVRVVESGLPEHFEYHCQHGNLDRWYQVSAAKLNDGFVVTFSDISNFKETYARMVLAEKVFEHSGEAITVTDAQNNILRVNQAFSDITGYAAEEVVGKNPRVLASGRNDSGFYREMWQTLYDKGHWEGEIWNRRKNGEVYPEWLSLSTVCDAHNTVIHHIGIFSDISERKTAEERIRFLANYDDLTQLPNRTLLLDRLNQAVAACERNRKHLAVLDIDIDNLKLVNDSLGNMYGDVALQTIGERIKASVRETDTVSRYNSDEFVVLLSDVSAEIASHLAQKILDMINQPYYFADHEVTLTASIGISVYPTDTDTPAILVRNAQAAMMAARKLGPGNISFFTQDMSSGAREQLKLINSLRHALGRGQFEVHYQPQVELGSHQIIGKEALLRWRHPELGLVLPGQFIPLAEASALIIPIGEWVLYEACRQNVADQRAGLPPVKVAVNISALQFRQGNLPDMIAKAIQETGMESRWLEVEVTESVVMHDIDSVVAMLEEIRGMGVEISVDDFGTGFSSLSYLKHLPIDKLKIDQSFVRDMASNKEDASIVRAITSLARSLGLRCIAEGVETDIQAAYLAGYGCEEGQGYYFGKPVPAQVFQELLLGEPTRAL